jgi:16S rRNA G966 N2-methylase RsmD
MYRAGGLKRLWDEFFECYLFDIVNKTDTYKRVPIEDYDRSEYIDHACEYMPSYSSAITKSIKKIIAKDKEVLNYQFIDIGCGKGKTLIIASKLGFKNGTGFELNKKLADIAKSNLYKKKINKSFNVLNCNAVKSDIIPCFSVCYFYNPFDKKLSEKFFHLLKKLKSGNNKYLVYVNPLYSELLIGDWSLIDKFNVGTQDIELWMNN